jgi:hypothetical protein
MIDKSNGKFRLNNTDRAIHHRFPARICAPNEGNRPAFPLFRDLALLVSVLSALVVAGCSTIPSRLYTTKDPTTLSTEDPTPCDTFTYGEHPIVVIEGFEHVSEASLEILTNGSVIRRQVIPMNSGQVNTSYQSPPGTYSSINGSYMQRNPVSYSLSVGAKVNLGAIPPGTYDLTLKTNDVVAAGARFKVNLPAGMETERQELESERLKLEQLADQLKQFNAEIDQDRTAMNQTNPATVTAFNAKVAHYNQLVQQAEADQDQFNIKAQNFNSRLEGLSGIPPFTGREIQLQ